jgi:hypothetical protein
LKLDAGTLSLTDANPLLRTILQIEEFGVQLLVAGMHRANGKGRGIDSQEGEDKVRQAGSVDVVRPDLVAGTTARVPMSC